MEYILCFPVEKRKSKDKSLSYTQLAWAPGVGVKGKDFQDYWEADLGVTYIPWNLLNTETDLTKLEEGGRIDDESAPEWVKGALSTFSRQPYEMKHILE